MDSKPIFRIGVFAALAVICGLCGLTAYATFNWLTGDVPRWDLWEIGDQSGQVTENYSYSAVPHLEITTGAGDVRVEAADVAGIEVEVVKSAWGRTVEEAEAAAAALTFEVVEGADTLNLVFDQPDEFGWGWKPGPNAIDFIVRVPADTSVILQTSFGMLSVSGLTGDAELGSDFGEIEVEDLTGALDASSSSASVTVKRVEAGEGAVTVRTDFGAIEVEDVTGGSIEIHSSNGPITAASIAAAGSILVQNDFGHIDLSDVQAASLEISNDNGRINVENGEIDGLLSADNTFGAVEVTGVSAAEYKLVTSNGNITLEDAGGKLTLETSFGEIDVTATSEATLDIQGSNGSIRFTGPLAQAPHKILSSFGDITLVIPAGSAFDLSLETDFGEIRSDIPLSLTGALDSGGESNHWEAAINGGGALLEATTSNGDVIIEVLPEPAGQ